MIARSLAHSKLNPGGTPIPFCEAVMTTSIPQSSNRISSLATEHTPSTMTCSPLSAAKTRILAEMITNQGIRRCLLCSLCQRSDVRQDTSGSVDMSNSHEFVLVGFELLNQLLDPDSISNRGLYLPRSCSICFKAFGPRALQPTPAQIL